MINKTLIRSESNLAAYQKGQDLFYNHKVHDIVVDESGDDNRIQAIVKGSGNNEYEVVMNVDTKNWSIKGSYCECPAYYGYKGICKHCVAVLFAYNKSLEEKDRQKKNQNAYKAVRSSSGMQFVDRPRSVKPKSGGAVIQKTPPAMKTLLAQYMIKRTLPVIQKEYCGKVRFEPWIQITKDVIKLEFRIGITQMYIMKDIYEFCRSMEENINFSYGKKLTFVHSLEAFREECRPLVVFLMNWIDQNKSFFLRSSYYQMIYGSVVKIRTITISTGDLEELLEVLPGNKLTGSIDGGEDIQWHTGSGEPDIDVKITGNQSGIDVDIDLPATFKGKQYYIFFQSDTIYRVPRAKWNQIESFMEYFLHFPEKSTFIQNEDIPLFCREILPGLEEICQCTMKNFKPQEYGVEEVSFEIYLDMPLQDLITCKIYAIYGDRKESVFGALMNDPSRDYVSEIQVGRQVVPYFNHYNDEQKEMVLDRDEEKQYLLLTEGIPRMHELGEVFITDSLKRIRVIPSPRVSVGVSLAGDLLELKLTAENMPLDELTEILAGYQKKRKFYRLKSGDFMITQTDSIGGLARLKEGLNLTDAQLKKGKLSLPKFRALFLDEEFKDYKSLSARKNKAFRSLVRNMQTVEDNDFEIPASLENILREYQKRGFLWVKTLHQNGFGGILADDMGLGKTLQIIAFLVSEYEEADKQEEKRCLIVAPASLVYNWQSEIEKFAPWLSVTVVVGSAGERKNILENTEKQVILLTSYDLLKRDLALYEGMQFFCQIIDEAQYIKNHNTQASKAVKCIVSGFRMALTGTPMENRLSELWSIFDYLMPGFLYTYNRFREDMEQPIVQNKEDEAASRLQKMIRPFVLRRLKKDVLTDLPDKLEENMFVVLEGEQQKLYDAHVKHLQLMLSGQTEEEFRSSRFQILSELTRLRQICCDPSLVFEGYHGGSAKMEMCMDLLSNAVNGGHKILIFSQFTSLLDNLIVSLEQEDISYYLLTGATSKEKRRELVEAFNKDDTSVFCISLKAGGTGLNLTAADIVIHFDPWWNMAVQNQATDRAHRIGQKNVVNVYKLIVKGTIEENIVKLQEKKRMLADQVLGGEGLDSGVFCKEELLELLEHV